MEKRGVITDQTPPEDRSKVRSGVSSGNVTTKQAADDMEEHASKRAAVAVAEAVRRGKTV